jgi:hypothetical protein
LIAHRRLFQQDQPRFFVGRVVAYQEGIAKVRGYSWVREHVRGALEKKADQRVKIVPVTSDALMIYQLPGEIALE